MAEHRLPTCQARWPPRGRKSRSRHAAPEPPVRRAAASGRHRRNSRQRAPSRRRRTTGLGHRRDDLALQLRLMWRRGWHRRCCDLRRQRFCLRKVVDGRRHPVAISQVETRGAPVRRRRTARRPWQMLARQRNPLRSGEPPARPPASPSPPPRLPPERGFVAGAQDQRRGEADALLEGGVAAHADVREHGLHGAERARRCRPPSVRRRSSATMHLLAGRESGASASSMACMIVGTPAMTWTLPMEKPGALETELAISEAPAGCAPCAAAPR